MNRIKLEILPFFFFVFVACQNSSAQETNYISNKEYGEFVEYVRDSIIRLALSKKLGEEYCTFNKDSTKI